jgi:predicted RNA methylase
MTSAAYLPGLEHEERLPDLSQWHTDPRLARKLWHWANRYQQPRTVLEPAAGHGALVRPIIDEPFACSNVVMLDVDPRCMGPLGELCDRARERSVGLYLEAECMDFMAEGRRRFGAQRFDLALENPPYEEGRAEEFVLQSLAVAERVVGVFKASLHHGASRYRMLWSRARVTREAKLASRPSFGIGASGTKQGETDFVALEIKRLDANEDMTAERWLLSEHWP